jgi:ABC-type uncharacterized transport system permease subunit
VEIDARIARMKKNARFRPDDHRPFLLDWTVALAAFWTTRVSAINQIHFMAVLFFSGQIAPLARLEETVGFREGAAFGAAILAGGLIIYSFWLILATTAFWLVRVENILMIFQSVDSAGRWPVSIYPAWLTT